MKRSMMFAIPLLIGALAFAAATDARAKAKSKTTVKVGQRYAGTVVFVERPEMVLIPRTRVYYMGDFDADLYRYGTSWYLVEDGAWYRASSWRGPFIRIRTSAVPRVVRTVPERYRQHWTVVY